MGDDTKRLVHPVVPVGVGMIALQLVFRAWALYPSWFYTDDYRLLYDARADGLSWSYLSAPLDSQFIPFGRFVAWVVAESGHVNWALAATITLGLQALASLACLWMLVRLFSPRWAVLAPLGIYLTTAIVMPAFMWWAASLNQLPWQVACFLAVGAWVSYLRTGRTSWLAATLGALAFGLLCYVKTLLVLPVLVFLLLGYFVSGSPVQRVRAALARFWPAATTVGILAFVYTAYYLTQVPQVFTDSAGRSVASDLAETMLGSSLSSGAVGGPWTWLDSNPPTGYADPPALAAAVSGIMLVLIVVTCFLLRERTGRAVLFFCGYAVLAYVLLLTSRAQIAGAFIGAEYRYLTDVAVILVLCLGLITMEVPGSAESSIPRQGPLLPLRIHALAPVALVLVAAVCLSGLISSATYAHIWHNNHPGAAYVENVQESVSEEDQIPVADQAVPATVIPGYSQPYNTTRRLLPLVSDKFRFPDTTPRLAVLDSGGHVRQAVINGTTGEAGPVRDCGWRVVGGKAVTIPLVDPVFNWSWWGRIGYLATSSTRVRITAGDAVVETELESGVHNLFVQLEGTFDEVEIKPLQSGVKMCVDQVEVGNPVPGGEW
ncbi:MAG: hypothetical protein L0H93_12620 [Nocardioides sp.]|nr:hypothetical protein [Nocardioides sp.]